MRIDKFLKISRLIKRRSVAKKACDADKVLVEGIPAKPSKEISEGDLITIIYPNKTIDVKVMDIPDRKHVPKNRARELYENLSVE